MTTAQAAQSAPKHSEIARKLVALVNSGAAFTDIHLVPGSPMLFRGPQGYQPYDGDLLSAGDIDTFMSLDGIAGADWKNDLAAQNGDLKIALTTSVARIRCNVYQTNGRNKVIRVVMRRLPLEVPSMQALGLPRSALERVLAERKGLFLITGPTGAGKTTTLASMLEHINTTRAAHILTIERPIEYNFKSKRSIISQQEVPMNVSSFEVGVESALQHDPDVIAIGEVLNRETLDALLRAANSGHLVLATLHSNSCADTISRLATFFEGAELNHKLQLLSTTLNGVISQVLMPGVDGKSWVMGYELVRTGSVIAQLIRKNEPHIIAESVAKNPTEGSVLLGTKLAQLVKEGKITLDTARFAAYDQIALDQELNKAGVSKRS
ncbi:MAG: type IV pilus twitching motility protein PilT [Acidiferrobacterales bacterium]